MKTKDDIEQQIEIQKKLNLEADEDRRIVVRVLSGEVNAYALLVEKYQKTVYNLLLRMIHNNYEARELTQAVFVKAYIALASYKTGYRFFSWIYRIAVNAALSHTKREERYGDLGSVNARADENGLTDDLSQELLQNAVKQLKEKYKVVIVLKYYEQLSYKEIAFTLDISEKKVRSRLYDARLMLKEMLEKSAFFESN